MPDVICQLLLFPPPDTQQDFLYKRCNFSSFQAKVFIYLEEDQDFSIEKKVNAASISVTQVGPSKDFGKVFAVMVVVAN